MVIRWSIPVADGDVVLMEPVQDPQRLRNGTVVSALVAGSGTLKHFHRQGATVVLEAANLLINRLNSRPNRWRCKVAWLPSGVRLRPSRCKLVLTADGLKPAGRYGAITQLVEHLHGMQGVKFESP